MSTSTYRNMKIYSEFNLRCTNIHPLKKESSLYLKHQSNLLRVIGCLEDSWCIVVSTALLCFSLQLSCITETTHVLNVAAVDSFAHDKRDIYGAVHDTYCSQHTSMKLFHEHLFGIVLAENHVWLYCKVKLLV